MAMMVLLNPRRQSRSRTRCGFGLGGGDAAFAAGRGAAGGCGLMGLGRGGRPRARGPAAAGGIGLAISRGAVDARDGPRLENPHGRLLCRAAGTVSIAMEPTKDSGILEVLFGEGLKSRVSRPVLMHLARVLGENRERGGGRLAS